MGGGSSGQVVLDGIRKQANQASRQHPSMASALVSASGFQVPDLTSFIVGQCCGNVSEINPFPSPKLFPIVGIFIMAMETLSKTVAYQR